MRALKIAGYVVGALIALIVVAVTLIVLFVDPNDYRDDIAAAVETRTGRKLTLSGDLKLSVFPWIALETGAATLSDAPGFGDEPFVSIDGARVSVKLLPLLRGQLEIGKVKLDGARIQAHNGMINTRLICHLPLIVPPGCGFRVGNETREWEVGKLLIFDDTIEHEAWNDSGEDRVVLIFDVWRPELSMDERRAVTAIFEAIEKVAIVDALSKRGRGDRHRGEEALVAVAEPDALDELAGELTPDAAADFLSGLLIGAELATPFAADRARPVTVAGGDLIAARYTHALALAGFAAVEQVSGEQAVARGLHRIWKASL